MKAKCPECGAVYNLDESKIPEKGAYANCSKCKTRFHIEKPGQTQAQAPAREPVKNDKARIIICPNCDHVNISSESCAACGMIFSKEEQEKLTQII